MLLLLLERQGEIVSREELQQNLWPADTFVDFDHSLSTIINKIREALGDTAANPRFVETLAKRGYRFVQPAEIVGHPNVPSESPQPVPILRGDAPGASQEVTTASAKSSLLTVADELPVVPRLQLRVLFLLIQIMYLSFYIASLARLPHALERLEHAFGNPVLASSVLIVTAAIGVPIRLYFLSAASFDVKSLGRKFRKLFVAVFILDELWALAPFLLTREIGIGLALAATAALLYVPFAQRTLLLMGEVSGEHGAPRN